MKDNLQYLTKKETETISHATWLDSQRYNFLRDGKWETRDEHLAQMVAPLLVIIEKLTILINNLKKEQ